MGEGESSPRRPAYPTALETARDEFGFSFSRRTGEGQGEGRFGDHSPPFMTLAEILSCEPLRQQEFPVARDKIFLAHAGVCPLPLRVADAIRDYAALCTQGDQETLLPAQHIHRSRELAARLLHAQPEEIGFVGPTSLALSFVAA